MSRKNPRLKALESRKQLLIAESELNRTHLVHELQTMAREVHALTRQAKTVSLIASAAASLVAGLAICRRQSASPPAGKPSWGQTIAKVAGLASTLWSAFRAPPKS
jgi:hypothetical protein